MPGKGASQLCSPIEGQLIEAELREIQRQKRRNYQQRRSGHNSSSKNGVKMTGNQVESKKWQFFGLNKEPADQKEKTAKLTSAMRLESQSLPKTYDQDVIQTQ